MSTGVAWSAYITIIGQLVALIVTLLSATVYRDVESTRISLSLAVLFIGFVIFVLAGTIFLWFFMFVFLLKYDQRSAISKFSLIVAFLLGTSLTAVLYYFLVYKELSHAHRHSIRAN
jgi:hypothetical protein